MENISGVQKPSVLKKLANKAKDLHKEFDKTHYTSEMKKGNILSARYDPFVKYMYQGVDDLKNYPMGPFTNNVRMILVDNILNNVTFLNDQEILKWRTDEKIKQIIIKNKTGKNDDHKEMEPLKIEETKNSKKDSFTKGKKGNITYFGVSNKCLHVLSS